MGWRVCVELCGGLGRVCGGGVFGGGAGAGVCLRRVGKLAAAP